MVSLINKAGAEKKCKCGCGKETSVISKTNLPQGRVKGEYNDYVKGHNRQFKSGKENPQYGKPNHWGHHTEETKLKISNNKERAANISKALMGIKTGRVPKTAFKKGHKTWNAGTVGLMPPAWNLGVPMREETKEKLRIAITGRIMPRGKDCHSYIHGEGYKGYSRDFRVMRNKILERDGFCCQECCMHQSELSETLHVHHKDMDKSNNSYENLITYCETCHYTLHSQIREERRLLCQLA